jgi:hypothetical protein
MGAVGVQFVNVTFLESAAACGAVILFLRVTTSLFVVCGPQSISVGAGGTKSWMLPTSPILHELA